MVPWKLNNVFLQIIPVSYCSINEFTLYHFLACDVHSYEYVLLTTTIIWFNLSIITPQSFCDETQPRTKSYFTIWDENTQICWMHYLQRGWTWITRVSGRSILWRAGHYPPRPVKVFCRTEVSLNRQISELGSPVITVLSTGHRGGAQVNLLSPCSWAGCTGCQTAGLHRSEPGCRGCATPRCFRPPGCCTSASRPASTASSRSSPGRRRCAPGPGPAASRPPPRLLRLQERRESRRSCNWPPPLRPDRRSLLLHRRLQTLLPCSAPTTPADRTAWAYTAEWLLMGVTWQHFAVESHGDRGQTTTARTPLPRLQWLNGGDASRSWKNTGTHCGADKETW